MERSNSRYIIMGISDGLFVGLGISLGVSFFNNYNFTFTAILLVGITAALSNFFSSYNAETFVTRERINEFKEALFVKEYNPRKLTEMYHRKSLLSAMDNFVATLVGSFVVLAPYIISAVTGALSLVYSSMISLVLALAVLGIIGSTNHPTRMEKIKGSIKLVGIGLFISVASALIGYTINTLL